MKQIAIIFFIVCSTSVFAQFSKGDKMLGGELSFSIKQDVLDVNRNFSRNISIKFVPKFGIFVTKNLALGGYLGCSERISAGSHEYHFRGLIVGLYGDRYFQITERIFFSLLGSVKYYFEKDVSGSVTRSGAESYYANVDINLTPNLIVFITPNWAFTGSLGGATYFHKINPKDNQEDKLSMSLGNTLTLGVSYYF